jgi:ribosomal protein L40E
LQGALDTRVFDRAQEIPHHTLIAALPRQNQYPRGNVLGRRQTCLLEGTQQCVIVNIIVEQALCSFRLLSAYRGRMSQSNGFCRHCGASFQGDSTYCPKCGANFSRPTSSPTVLSAASGPSSPARDWRELGRQSRARRMDRYGPNSSPSTGPLIVATVIVVGLGIFFPELPWSAFWGSLVIILGLWILYLWLLRSRGQLPPQGRT